MTFTPPTDDAEKKLDELKVVANSNDSEKTVELLADLVPTFNHKTN